MQTKHIFFFSLKARGGGTRSIWLGIWIPFIGFRQNLAWTYHLTLGTTLWKRFSFFSKSKMAAGSQKLNFDIISARKSHFGLANGSLSSDLDKIRQADTTQS
jgi:hypothetical protein